MLKKLAEVLWRILNPRADLSSLNRRSSHDSEPQKAWDDLPERRVRLRHVLFNFPLLVGGMIVLTLFLGVLFGPLLAPENPYLRMRRVMEYVDGVMRGPPFPPSPDHWLGTDELGRDTLSMLLYGTRNTLVAATFITMARLVLGLVLGGLAGWNADQWIDRTVMGAVQVLSALPMLLVSMILILALDIRQGLPVFIIALCSVGWGEIAQYVRAEFIRIKKEPFLDSGRAIGLSSVGLAVRHILPNILPALIVITLLEMGAVLMLLGELGFIGIYISGGLVIQVGDVDQELYFSVPEWGAMMAGSRMWALSRPWMVLFPAAAFFLSVTGFNLLGEGLRRLIDRGIFNPAVLLSWRAVVIIALIAAASVYVTLTLGPAPSYQNLARQVSEADLMRHVEFLGRPEMNGRAPGSPEAHRAAEYIAAEFASYGLRPPPRGMFQEVDLVVAALAGSPELALVDEGGRALTVFERLVDYGESVERHGGSGEGEGPLTLVIFPPSPGADPRTLQEVYASYKGLILRDRIVMFLASNAPTDFETEALIRGARGVLVVTSDITPRDQILAVEDREYPTLPLFRITPEAADVLLAGNGLDVASIQAEISNLNRSEVDWVARDLEARVRMRVQFEAPETVTLYNVMGLINGSDAILADELVVVSCHYDGLGRSPEGLLYPGANGNASGVAVMLEIARLWQEQHFQPRRSVLFVAWGGGEWPYSGAHFFRDRPDFIPHYDVAAVIHLDRLGGADGEGLVMRPAGGPDNLVRLLMNSARTLDVEVSTGLARRHSYQWVFSGQYGDELGGENGSLIVTWGDPPPALDDDTVSRIDLDHLVQAAQVVNLTLITAAHEPSY